MYFLIFFWHSSIPCVYIWVYVYIYIYTNTILDGASINDRVLVYYQMFSSLAPCNDQYFSKHNFYSWLLQLSIVVHLPLFT